MKPCWILSYARSGSTFFRDLMNATDLFPRKGFAEKFHHTHPKERIRREFEEDPGYFKHVKVLRQHFDHKFVDSDKAYIERKLPGIKYIRLRRKNILEVAVSLYFAEYTGTWYITSDQQKASFLRREIPYDEKRLIECYNNCKNLYTSWDAYLAKTNFLNIEYEELVQNPKEVLNKGLKYLGINLGNKKLSNIVANYSHKEMKRPDTAELVQKLKHLTGQ